MNCQTFSTGFAEWCLQAHLQDPHFPHIKGISDMPSNIVLPVEQLLWDGSIIKHWVDACPWFKLIEIERLLPITIDPDERPSTRRTS